MGAETGRKGPSVAERFAVPRLLNALLAVLASLSLCLMPGSYAAAGPIELSDILDIDPLGYHCVPSEHFDEQADGSPALAFSLTGKTRLPRTCLPDPCARALTKTELSQITGTEPILAKFSEEWDDYYTRYADHCVREITVSRPADVKFWKPILKRAETTQQTGIPTSSRRFPYMPSSDVIPEDVPAIIKVNFLDNPLGGLGPDRITPSPVPVPASGLMLGAVIGGGLFAARRRRKRAIYIQR